MSRFILVIFLTFSRVFDVFDNDFGMLLCFSFSSIILYIQDPVSPFYLSNASQLTAHLWSYFITMVTFRGRILVSILQSLAVDWLRNQLWGQQAGLLGRPWSRQLQRSQLRELLYVSLGHCCQRDKLQTLFIIQIPGRVLVVLNHRLAREDRMFWFRAKFTLPSKDVI